MWERDHKEDWGWKNCCFQLWCWRRLLRFPWTVRRSHQSVLKEMNPEYSLEGLMLNRISNPLATRCKELTHWKRPWCLERLRARGEGDNRGWDRRWYHLLNGWEFEQTPGDSKGQGSLASVHRAAKSWTQLSDWKITTVKIFVPSKNSYVEFNHDDAIRRVFGRQLGLPSGSKRKNLSSSQETGFNPWVQKIPWRREWLPTPVCLPGEFHGQRNLESYSPWVHK